MKTASNYSSALRIACLFGLFTFIACVASLSISRQAPVVIAPDFFDSNEQVDSRFDFDLLRSGSDNITACYKNVSTRGVGTIPNTCSEGMEKSGGLCYPLCKANYTGKLTRCYEDCPEHYETKGTRCKPISQYGNNTACPSKDRCGVSKNDKGCVKCPEGMYADGCYCYYPGHAFTRKSYGRGIGHLMKCAAGLEEQAGLCYKPCPSGSVGETFLCWESCAGNYSYSCAGSLCTPGKDYCDKQINGLANTLLTLQVQLAECILHIGEDEERRENWKARREQLSKIIAPSDDQEDDDEDKSEQAVGSVFHRLFNYFQENFFNQESESYNHHHHHHHKNHSHHHHHHHHCNVTEIEEQIDYIIDSIDLPSCEKVE